MLKAKDAVLPSTGDLNGSGLFVETQSSLVETPTLPKQFDGYVCAVLAVCVIEYDVCAVHAVCVIEYGVCAVHAVCVIEYGYVLYLQCVQQSMVYVLYLQCV